MSDSKFKVLLYSDGSHQAFSAAVYTATLLQKMPNMHLAVAHIQENNDPASEPVYSWLKSWPSTPTSEWMKHVFDDSDPETKRQFNQILLKTNEIFSKKDLHVRHQALYAKSESISDTAKVIIDYAIKDSCKLIIMGTRGLSTFKGLVYGSLAHHVLDDSPIPVLLIKKLPQYFIDSYLSNIVS